MRVLPPPLGHALAAAAGHDPAAAARAADALGHVTDTLASSRWPEVAWSFSHLCVDGYPIELAFCSASPELRWAAEVAGPEVPSRARLARAAGLLQELGGGCLPGHLLQTLERSQAGGRLRWGAWLGGRHGVAGDRYKLFAEAPPGPAGEELVRALFGHDRRLARSMWPRMVGYEPATGRTETYLAVEGLVWERLADVLAVADIDGSRLAGLQELVEDTTGWKAPVALAGGRQWVSVSTAGVASPPAVTVFTAARSVLGSDATVRAAVLRLAERRAWDMEVYRAVSRPLADRRRSWFGHGLIGFAVAGTGAPVLHLTLRPPDDLAGAAASCIRTGPWRLLPVARSVG